jgi:chaperone BCS1
MSLADRALSDDRVMHLMNNVPEKTFLLLEDVDCVVPTRAGYNHNQQQHNNVTLSGLLNAIDGAVASEERIVMMTTNHPDVLDPALVRPGRIDVRLEVGVVEEGEQGAGLFMRFYPGRPGAERFGAASIGWSPAHLQGLLIDHPDDPLAAQSALDACNLRRQGHLMQSQSLPTESHTTG